MIDACANHAMPIMYSNWRYGKSQIQQEREYKAGRSGLADLSVDFLSSLFTAFSIILIR